LGSFLAAIHEDRRIAVAVTAVLRGIFPLCFATLVPASRTTWHPLKPVLVEITPSSIRLRKWVLAPNMRG